MAKIKNLPKPKALTPKGIAAVEDVLVLLEEAGIQLRNLQEGIVDPDISSCLQRAETGLSMAGSALESAIDDPHERYGRMEL